MNLFVASALLTSTASFLLAAFVYSKGTKKTLNQTLALFSLSLAIWTFSQAMAGIVKDKEIVIIWTRVQLAGAVFLPPFFLHFVFSLLNINRGQKRVLWFSYLVALSLFILNFSPLFVNNIRLVQGYRYYPRFTVVYALFALWLTISFMYGLGRLILELRRSCGNQYKKLLYVFVASLVGFLGGATSFFPIFNIALPVVSHLTLPIYVAVAVYAIVVHQLIDITTYVRKGLIYSIITVFFTSLYIVLILLADRFFETITQYNSILATAFVVFSLALFFQPLRDRVQNFINQFFFKGYYDYQDIIKGLSQDLSSVLRIEELEVLIKKKLAQTIKPEWVEVCWGETQPSLMPVLSVAIKSKKRILGRLCLGPKRSGDGYLTEDKNLLDTLANQVGISLENIHLYQSLVRSESLAALGTMAAGMAHEIKNPLASIKGMTQVLPENLDDPEFICDYTEMIPRQLDRINRIVENLLRAGRTLKLEKREIDLNNVIDEVLGFNANLCKKSRVEIKKKLTSLPLIYADPEQLQQVFTNLILNAVQAMPNGGVLSVISSMHNAELICVMITDTGHGIPADKINRVFDPFFTLKEKGSGLGLFTAFRVLQEHGGKIDVFSQPGKETRFTLWLPIKQERSV
jgi:signal transduction histidine kinase